jgi:hypothetical protein
MYTSIPNHPSHIYSIPPLGLFLGMPDPNKYPLDIEHAHRYKIVFCMWVDYQYKRYGRKYIWTLYPITIMDQERLNRFCWLIGHPTFKMRHKL